MYFLTQTTAKQEYSACNISYHAYFFIKDNTGRILMIKRRKPPNLNTWSPPGGKVEMNIGESPYECAIREAYEEVGLKLQNSDLRLFGYISEKSYEGTSHWLMFLLIVW